MKAPLLTLNNVSLKIPDLPQPILSNINYKVYPEDFIILLGHNGSGKSSLLKVIDQRYPITKGEILLQGKNLKNYKHRNLTKDIVTLTQNCHDALFTSLTVLENCLITKQVHNSDFLQIQTSKEKEFFTNYLKDFNRNLAKKLDVPTLALSGGEQQALTLALNILYPPKIMLLDEHTSALDPQASKTLMQITANVIKKHKITCVLSTHDLNLTLNYGNRILALANGKIIQQIENDQKKSLKADDIFKFCY